MAVMMLADDHGSMHRKAHLDEAERVIDTIFNLTIKHDGQELIYNKMCDPYCFTKELFKTFKRHFDINYESAVKNHYYSSLCNLSYPFASIWGHRVPIEQCLYGVELAYRPKSSSNYPNGANTQVERIFFDDKKIEVDPNLPIESQITNMRHVSVLHSEQVFGSAGHLYICVNTISKGGVQLLMEINNVQHQPQSSIS
ncbi:MMPL [Parelaphostrongylus tenuis]|uniref:MMPL n=1 Tax=Parelaphostrongylus tenuis TaxID=148309 RepID=A0AAD5QTM8_PARTN|nr:MMPL [Parelaphostrongylus tenuis]